MALEISETGIHLTVGEPAAAPPAENEGTAPSPTLSPSRIGQIVNACVQRVLATLKRLQAR